MDSEQAIKAVAAIRSAWPYQPMDGGEERAWLRALTDTMTHVAADEARDALDRAIAAGGSRSANQPGRRPGVAEFIGSITGERSKRRPAVRDTRSTEPMPDDDPEYPQYVSAQVAAIKERVGLR